MAPRRKVTSEAVLRALHRFQVEHGHPPTIEELRAELGLGSTRTALRYLQELQDEGRIDRWSGARGIKLTQPQPDARSTISVPLVGEAPAGSLMDAQENFLGSVQIVRPAREQGKLFLLRVRGDSMNSAIVNDRKIEDGDLVLVRQTTHAHSGDVIVALVDGQATIKRLAIGSHYAVLKPDSTNTRHEPIIVSEALSIQGIVIDVIKEGAVNVWDA
jgi:repressor LexA